MTAPGQPEHAGAAAALVELPTMTTDRLRRVLAVLEPAAAFESLQRGGADAGAVARLADPCAREAARTYAVARTWTEAARRSSPDEVLARYTAAGVAIAVRGSAQYPAPLLGFDRSPAVVFAAGARAEAPRAPSWPPAVAVVGTRSATHYGLEIAAELGSGLSAAGVSVVSGLALGIDSAAHEGSLVGGGQGAFPLAVLGCGIDVVYPARTARLRQRYRRHRPRALGHAASALHQSRGGSAAEPAPRRAVCRCCRGRVIAPAGRCSPPGSRSSSASPSSQCRGR